MELTKIDNDVEDRLNQTQDELNNIKKEIRSNEIKLNPFYSWINDNYVNIQEKEMLFDSIINEIKDWRTATFELERVTKKLGSFCILNCDSCRKWFDMECLKYSSDNDIKEPIPHNIFMKKYEKLNYKCGPSCKYLNLSNEDPIIKEYNNRLNEMKLNEEIVEKLSIGYKVAFEQQKNLVKQYSYLTTKFKEINAILIFKKRKLQYLINCIQISIIIISTVITFFESIKSSFKDYIDNFTFSIIPIICSSYIALVLAISRFFKLDSNNENIIKLTEKYSFIINKLRQKRTKYLSFDFKIHNLKEWNDLMNLMEKDSIDDIIMKANEEFDMVMNPSEFVKFKKIYTKIRIKELNERENFKELERIVRNNHKLSKEQKEMAQNIIKKRNCFKYYFCMLCCCNDRYYVDYNNILVENRNKFMEYFNDSIRFEKENKLYLAEVDKLKKKIKQEEALLTEEKVDNPKILLGMFKRCPSEKEDDSIIEKYSSSPNEAQVVVKIENDEGKNIDV